MRRLIPVLLSALLASSVQAKTLVVVNEAKIGSVVGYNEGERVSKETRRAIICNILDAFGASYKVMPEAAMRTEWARTGVVTWNFGTTAAYTESFDAVIHATFARKNTGSPSFTSYRPDSLTLASKLPVVPQLMLYSSDAANNMGINPESGMNATTCSTGVAANGLVGAGLGTGSHDEEGSYYSPTSGRYFSGTTNAGHAHLSYAAANAAKGLSNLLAQGTAQAWKYSTDLNTPTAWDVPLGMSPAATADTALVWVVRNIHNSSAKPIIYAALSPGIGDGSESATSTSEIVDMPILLTAMAALDSASGGLVFDNQSRIPLKVGITVDGLCSRSTGNNSGGIAPGDTASLYATIDSIAAHRIPMVFGVNVDSMCCYLRDIQYPRANAPTIRFTPQSRAGLDTAVAFAPTGGITHRFRAVDTFGRYRNQARAYGPAGGATADTSLYAKLVYARALGDSVWGAGRSSRFAMPTDDDWSPYNLRVSQADKARGVVVDSILYAYAKAGFLGLRINGAWTRYRQGASPTNPRGWIFKQGRYATADPGTKINLLAHQGGSTFGNIMFESQTDSTAPPASDPGPSLGFNQASHFWNGLFGHRPIINSDGTVYCGGTDAEGSTREVQALRIMKLSAQELAGPAAATDYKHLPRPGWWSIRMVTEPIAIINQVAGRSLFQVDYPENIVLHPTGNTP